MDAGAISGGTRLKTGADRAMEQRRMLEEKRIEAKMAVLVNEWGESLDDLQAMWRPPAQHPKTHLRTVSEFGGIMARSEAAESTYRDTFKVAKNTDARIQQLAIAETLRDTNDFLSQRAIKADRSKAALPFGAAFTYRDLFHCAAAPAGVAPCLDAVQGSPVRSAAFVRAGNVLATGSNDCGVRLWVPPKAAALFSHRRAAEKEAKGKDAQTEKGEQEAEANEKLALTPRSLLASYAAGLLGGSGGDAARGETARGNGTGHVTCAAAAAPDGPGLEKTAEATVEADPADEPAQKDAKAQDTVAGDLRDESAKGCAGAPWRSVQQLRGHASPVTACVFVGSGELGERPVLFTAASDWKIVEWQPDDVGAWIKVREVPVSHAACIMDLCYVSKAVCARCQARGPLLVTAAGDKTLKIFMRAKQTMTEAEPEPELESAREEGGLDADASVTEVGEDEQTAAAVVSASPASGGAGLSGGASPAAGSAAGSPGAGRRGGGRKVTRLPVSGPAGSKESGNTSRQHSRQGSVASSVASHSALGSPVNRRRGGEDEASAVTVAQTHNGIRVHVPQVLASPHSADSRGGSARTSVAASPVRKQMVQRQVAGWKERMDGSEGVVSGIGSGAGALAGSGGASPSATLAGAMSVDSAGSVLSSARSHGGETPALQDAVQLAERAMGNDAAEEEAMEKSGDEAGHRAAVETGGEGPSQRPNAVVAGWVEVATLQGHRESVFSVCCSETPYTKHVGGRGTPHLLLASVALDWSVRIWRLIKRSDPSSWQCEATLMDAVTSQSPGRPMHFLPQDASVLVTAHAEDVQLWRLEPGDDEDDVIVGQHVLASLQGHMAAVTCVQFRPDGLLLASCDTSGEVRLWTRVVAEGEQELGVRDTHRSRQAELTMPATSRARLMTVSERSEASSIAAVGTARDGERHETGALGRPLRSALKSSDRHRDLKGHKGGRHDGGGGSGRDCGEGDAQILVLDNEDDDAGGAASGRVPSTPVLYPGEDQSDMPAHIQLSGSPPPSRDRENTADRPLSVSLAPGTAGAAAGAEAGDDEHMQWLPLSRSYAGNANARVLAFGVDFTSDSVPADTEKDGDSAGGSAMLAVANDKGRVRMWNTALLRPVGLVLSDTLPDDGRTAPPTPAPPRPKTVVDADSLSALELGHREWLPSWHTLAAARPGACLALLANEGKVAAACYPDLEGAFLLWDTASPQAYAERTASIRNAGSSGTGGEQRVFPHTCAITCMAALHREFTSGQVHAVVVTGAADGTIRLTPAKEGGLTEKRGYRDGDGRSPSERDKVVRHLVRAVHVGEDEYAGPSRPPPLVRSAHRGAVLRVESLGDGMRLLSSGEDGHVTVWDTASGAILFDYVHATPVLAVCCGAGQHPYAALSSLLPPPDLGGHGQLLGDQRLLAGARGDMVFVNLQLGSRVGTPIRAHSSEIVCLAMSPRDIDGVLVASCARGDAVVKLISMDQGSVLHRLRAEDTRGTGAGVCVVKFDASGKVLACGDSAGCVRLWSPMKASLLAVLPGHAAPVLAISFPSVSEHDGRPVSRVGSKTPMATQVVTSGADARVRVWRLVGQANDELRAPVGPRTLGLDAVDPGSGQATDKSAQACKSDSTRVGENGTPAQKPGSIVNAVSLSSNQTWECHADLEREALVLRLIRQQVTRLSTVLGVVVDRDAAPLRGGDAPVLDEMQEEATADSEDEDEENAQSREGAQGEEEEEEGARVMRVGDAASGAEEAERATAYTVLLSLARQLMRIGLVDPADEIDEAQARRTAVWAQRQKSEADALARLAPEQRRRAERNRKPRTGPPPAPITVTESVERRRAAAAQLVREMEGTRVLDEPASIAAVRRLLASHDADVRAVASLGLGLLCSRAVELPVPLTTVQHSLFADHAVGGDEAEDSLLVREKSMAEEVVRAKQVFREHTLLVGIVSREICRPRTDAVGVSGGPCVDLGDSGGDSGGISHVRGGPCKGEDSLRQGRARGRQGTQRRAGDEAKAGPPKSH